MRRSCRSRSSLFVVRFHAVAEVDALGRDEGEAGELELDPVGAGREGERGFFALVLAVIDTRSMTGLRNFSGGRLLPVSAETAVGRGEPDASVARAQRSRIRHAVALPAAQPVVLVDSWPRCGRSCRRRGRSDRVSTL